MNKRAHRPGRIGAALRLAAMLAAGLAPAQAPAQAAAQEQMTAEAFEAYAQGKTLYYAMGNQPYGAEQYLPGRQVIWAFLGQQCRRGTWYEDQGDICFVYEDGDGPQCWTFYHSAEGLSARFRGDPASEPLTAVRQSPDPLSCAGPDLGV